MLKFSVLMSVYKNEKPEYLKQAIESIVNQTLLPNEIVIVKDGLLTYDLDKVIEAYQTSYKDLFKIVAFNKNRGLGLALRDGVLACSHEYIARMDSDDVCKLIRFERQIEYLENKKIFFYNVRVKYFHSQEELEWIRFVLALSVTVTWEAPISDTSPTIRSKALVLQLSATITPQSLKRQKSFLKKSAPTENFLTSQIIRICSHPAR